MRLGNPSHLISVVTVTLNQINRIEAFVRNVHQQIYRPLELVVVDGGSADGTIEKVGNLAGELSDNSFSIRLISESQFGTQRSSGNARNIGSRVARGSNVIFMDPDMSFTNTDSVGMIASKLETVRFTRVRTTIIVDTDLEKFLAQAHPRYHNCAYRKEVLEKVQFDPSLGYGEDQDFMYRVKRDVGLDTDQVCEVTLARHLPHTRSEFLRQTIWYASTMPNFIEVVVRRKEDELRNGLCDWLRFWSFCFLPFLAFEAPLLDYLRRRGVSRVELSFLLWNSIVRRYISLCYFLRTGAKTKTLQVDLQLLLSCMWNRLRSRHF